MNKILLIVGILVVAGGAYFGLSSKNSGPSNVGEPEQEVVGYGSPVVDQNAGKKMAFEDFLKNGEGVWACDVAYNADQVSSTGKVFVNGKNIRGDFTSSVQGMTVGTSFISKDGMTYTWSSMAPFGFKTPVASGQTQPDKSTETKGAISVDMKQIGDYECKPWTLDESQFIPPSNITFKQV